MTHDPADPYFPAYGDRTYSVEHYDLGLDYSLESNQLDGSRRHRRRRR